MAEHVKDKYVKEAEKLNYRSRAAFKLLELQDKYKFMKKGFKVLDLGSSPGGWTQIAVQSVGINAAKPLVLSIDKLPMPPVNGSKFLEGDIFDKEIQLTIYKHFEMSPVDVIISDMSPNISGLGSVDDTDIIDLNFQCMKIAWNKLRPGGTLLMKSFHGQNQKETMKNLKSIFNETSCVKPDASRSRSKEFYFLARGFKLTKNFAKIKEIVEKSRDLNYVYTDEELRIIGVDYAEEKRIYFESLQYQKVKNGELKIPAEELAEIRRQDEEFYEKIQKLIHSDVQFDKSYSFNELNDDEKLKKLANLDFENKAEINDIFESNSSYFDQFQKIPEAQDELDPKEGPILNSEEEAVELENMIEEDDEGEIKDYTHIRKFLNDADISDDELPDLNYMNKLVSR